MPQEDSLLREVDDAVRHDRMLALWQRYRQPLFAAAIALVVATAGGSVWNGYQEKKAGESMQQFAIAQAQYDAGAYKDAADSFATTADIALKGELRDLAQLWEARALEAGGKKNAAVKRLEELATNPQGGDLVWRDLACLRLVGIDSSKTACLKDGASPLAGERDLVRAAVLWQDGKADEAAALLTKLANDPNANDSVRTRAQQYLSAVAVPATKRG